MSTNGSKIGSHTICADTGFPVGAQAIAVRACLPYTIEPFQPKVTLNVNSGGLGTQFTISASGFPPNDSVVTYVDVQNPDTQLPQPIFFGTPFRLDDQGRLIVPVSWPNNPVVFGGGTYNVCAETGNWAGSSRYPSKACAQFILEAPAATPSPSPVPSASPTPALAANPAAAHTNRAGPPFLALLAAAAALIVAGVVWFVWFKRTQRGGAGGI
jgi:hypothetical protein